MKHIILKFGWTFMLLDDKVETFHWGIVQRVRKNAYVHYSISMDAPHPLGQRSFSLHQMCAPLSSGRARKICPFKTAPFRKFRFPPRTISWTHFDGIRALSGSILVILAQNISGFKSMVGSKYIQFKTGRTRKILFR